MVFKIKSDLLWFTIAEAAPKWPCLLKNGAASAISEIWFLLSSVRHYFLSRGRQH